MFTCSASHLRLRNNLRPYLSNLFFALCVCCLVLCGINLFRECTVPAMVFGVIAGVLVVIGIFFQASLIRNTVQVHPDTVMCIPCSSGRDLLVLDDNSEWHFGYCPGIIELPRRTDDTLTFYCTTPHDNAAAKVTLQVRYLINPHRLTQLDRWFLAKDPLTVNQLTVCVAACFAEALAIKNGPAGSLTYRCHNLHVVNKRYLIDTTIGFSSNPDFTYVHVNFEPLSYLEDFRIFPQRTEIVPIAKLDDISPASNTPIIKLPSLPVL